MRLRNVRHAPRYTAAEASRYLRLPLATLRAWLRKRHTKTGAAGHWGQCLSFVELIDLADQAASRLRGHAESRRHCIERDKHGVPTKLYLQSAKGAGGRRGEIVIDPRISFGRPVLAGTGISVDIITDRFGAGESIDCLSSDYARSREDIEAILRSEFTTG